MASDPKLDLLRKVPLFGELSRRELQRVAQLADEIDLPADRVLMRQGDRGDSLFVLLEGEAKVERNGQVVAERGPGEFFGEIALVVEGPRTATVTLTRPSRLLVIGHREFHALMDQFPSIRLCVLETLARRVRILEADAAH